MKSKIRFFLWLIILIIILINFTLLNSCTSGCGNNNSNPPFTPEKTTSSKDKHFTNSKFNYHIFIENSGSMDGYVKGVTQFEQATYNIISDIKDKQLSNNLNLFYINSRRIPLFSNASTEQLGDFIQKLEPSNFIKKGGNRDSSDMQKIVKMVFDSVNSKSVSLIVSDFIFSPGKKVNAQNYLINQQIGFKSLFSDKLSDMNISTLMLQFHSQFQGNYFDKENRSIDFNNKPIQRPFYMMIIGQDSAITQFLGEIDLNSYKARGFVQMCYFHIHDDNPRNSSRSIITYKDRIGNYEFELPATRLILNDAEPSENINTKGKFIFSVAVDFSNIIEDKKYFTNPENYEVPQNYTLIIDTILDSTEPATKGYTHLLKLTTSNLKNQDVFIRLLDKLPNWVADCNSDNDTTIYNSSDEQTKTFGLKYLLEGINEAYKNKFKKYLFSINVKVNKSN